MAKASFPSGPRAWHLPLPASLPQNSPHPHHTMTFKRMQWQQELMNLWHIGMCKPWFTWFPYRNVERGVGRSRWPEYTGDPCEAPACSTPAGRLCGLEVPVMVTLGLATAYTVKPYSTSGASIWYLDAKDQSGVLPLPVVGFGVSHLNLFRLSFLIHQIGMMVPKSLGWPNVSMRWDIRSAQYCAWHIISARECGTSSARRVKVTEPLF